jgi:transcription termination/antitermination protein NusA
VTLQMAILLGKGGIKTLEDLADAASDELRGWFETKNGERTRFPGILDSMQLSQEDADALIINARVTAGWIEAPPEPEIEETEEDPDAPKSEKLEDVFRT